MATIQNDLYHDEHEAFLALTGPDRLVGLKQALDIIAVAMLRASPRDLSPLINRYADLVREIEGIKNAIKADEDVDSPASAIEALAKESS